MDDPRPKVWHERRLVTEHAFDKLRAIDCGLAEFFAACEAAEVIEEVAIDEGVKELVLTVSWVRPLHLVVIVDSVRQEDRVATVYEPDPARLVRGRPAASMSRCVRCDEGERRAVTRAKMAERAGHVAIVLDVPMEECVACGERYLDWPVAARLDDLLTAMLAGGAEVATRHFEASTAA